MMNDKKLPYNQDRVPMNLDEAVALLKAEITPDIEKYIKKSSSTGVHFGLGMQIRNDWSLWDKENPLVKWFFKEYGVDHADDISGLILDCLWQDIKGLPRRDREQSEKTKRYWNVLKEAQENGSSVSIDIDSDGNLDIKPNEDR